MLHKKISADQLLKLGDEELFGLIVNSTARIVGEKSLLFAGFEGLLVARNRSFGNRWHTFAMTQDEAEESLFQSPTPNIIGYAEGRNHKLPAVGVFDATKLLRIMSDNKLYQRYVNEIGGVPGIDEYGVHGTTLDIGAIAVYYFMSKSPR